MEALPTSCVDPAKTSASSSTKEQKKIKPLGDIHMSTVILLKVELPCLVVCYGDSAYLGELEDQIQMMTKAT